MLLRRRTASGSCESSEYSSNIDAGATRRFRYEVGGGWRADVVVADLAGGAEGDDDAVDKSDLLGTLGLLHVGADRVLGQLPPLEETPSSSGVSVGIKLGEPGSHKLLEPRTHAGLAEKTTGVVKACHLSREATFSRTQVLRTPGLEIVVDVTVLGLVGGAPGGETPRVADSSAA